MPAMPSAQFMQVTDSEEYEERQAAVAPEGQEEVVLKDALGDEGEKVAANQQEREQRVASEEEDEEVVGEQPKKVRRLEWRAARKPGQ